MNNKYDGLSVAKISSFSFDILMFHFSNSSSVLFMTSSKSVSSLILPVSQMVILPVRGGYVDDLKYIFITFNISGSFLSYLIGR